MSQSPGSPLDGDIDLQLDVETTGVLGWRAARNLATKGFCNIYIDQNSEHCDQFLKWTQDGQDVDFTLAQVLNEAIAEVERGLVVLREEAVEIRQGLLGQSGSRCIAELVGEKGHDEEDSSPKRLLALAQLLRKVGKEVQQYSGEFGLHHSRQCNALVHEAGDPTSQEASADLTDQQVLTWLHALANTRLMAILFMGPCAGTLNLQLHHDNEAAIHSIEVPVGSLVLVRPDL
eukprot:1299672-Amphidinium_carterae.1